MKLIADLHTHTLFSSHAYATYEEMARAAARRGLLAIGIADHGPAMPGAPHDWYYGNMIEMDEEVEGVRVLRSVEANVRNDQGLTDITDPMRRTAEYIILSMHTPTQPINERDYNTTALLRAMEDPDVKIIGHPDEARMPVDIDAVVKGAAQHGKILEVNNHSLEFPDRGDAARQSYRRMLALCRAQGVPIAVGSDAHSQKKVGYFDLAIPLLEEIDFPEALVVNASAENLKQYLNIVL